MNPPDKKHCRKCGVELVAGENWSDSRAKDGSKICKTCDRKQFAAYHAANRERRNAMFRAWREKNKEMCAQNKRRWDCKNPIKLTVLTAKKRAKKSCVPFTLCTSDVADNKLCPALGVELRWGVGTGMRTGESRSLDKLVPSAGYTPGNVCIISHRANVIKSDATPEESLAVALYSYTYTGHSVSDIHAAVDAILAKQAEYRRINEAARNIDNAQHCCP